MSEDIRMYTINITLYKFVSSFSIILYFSIPIFIVLKKQRISLAREFSNFCLFFAVYNFTVLMLFFVQDTKAARFFMQINIFAGTPIPILWYLLLRKAADSNYSGMPYKWDKNFSKRKGIWKWPHDSDSLLLIYVVIDFIFLYLSFLINHNIKMQEHKYWYYSVSSFIERPLWSCFGIFFIGVVGHALYHVWQASNNTSHMKKRFFRELFFFSAICSVMLIIDIFFLSQGIGPFPPSPFFGIFYICFLFFSLIQYRFITVKYNIESIVSSFWGFILIVGFNIVIYSSLVEPLIHDKSSKIFVSALFVLVSFFIFFRYLRPEKTDQPEKYLRSRGDESSIAAPTFDDLKEIIKQTVNNEFGSTDVGVVISRDIEKDENDIEQLIEEELKLFNIEQEKNDEKEKKDAMKNIVVYLFHQKETDILDQFAVIRGDSSQKEFTEKMQSNMKLLRSELIAPIYDKNEQLIGVIFLGERKIRIPYSLSDINRFKGLIEVFSIAIENARLLEYQSEMLTNISHELKTPLATVRTFAQFIEKTKELKKPETRNSLDMILRENKRHEALIDNLIDLSKVRSGKSLSLRNEPFNLNEIINDTLDIFSLNIQTKKISVVFNPPRNLSEIEGDKDKIKQVVINFISNSIKYTPKGGKIEIVLAPRFHVGDNSSVKVSVTDTGVGVPESETSKLFHEKYYRAQNARQTGSGGTGLGLIVSRHIVEAHGGKIGVKSAEGEGSVFWFTLPLKNKVSLPLTSSEDNSLL